MKIKEISWIIVLLVFCTNNTFAQVKFGIATGITPSHIDPGEIIISNIDDSIKYSITSTSANWQVGTFLRFQAGNFYVRGSVLANFGSVNYDKDNLKNTGISTLNARDHTINCDIPIEVGFQIKDRFLVHAGLHWSDFFRPEEESLLKNLPENFIDIFNDSQIGYTGGIGFDIDWQVDTGACSHMSAFIGEEMTFTGEGVSMPGSAAVAGQAAPEAIHKMRNQQGEQWGERLQTMLAELKQAQAEGRIQLFNRLDKAADEGLLDACSDPRDFYSPHSYERHIEQGPILDRANVPIVQVGTIMGIYQEDFTFSGQLAEAAALELNRQVRALTQQRRFSDVRITVGILEGQGQPESLENVYPALRWTLDGEMNHAGATPTPDRRDPGVAAARLVREFLDWYDKVIRPGESFAGIKPVVGNIRLTPGCNRNVIPGSASITTALTCDDRPVRGLIDELTREDLAQTLEGYVIGTLARQVAGGGEGIRLWRVDPVCDR